MGFSRPRVSGDDDNDVLEELVRWSCICTIRQSGRGDQLLYSGARLARIYRTIIELDISSKEFLEHIMRNGLGFDVLEESTHR